MLFEKTNVEEKLQKRRTSDGILFNPLELVSDILEENEAARLQISETLETPSQQDTNAFYLDLLETEQIYHVDTIKKICVDYRLRFLDSARFKGPIPEEALSKIRRLEKEHDTKLDGFKIMAPAKLMKLENADDPLLFAPIGNGYYYLIHKWGNDLHPFRRLLMWPYKNFDNLILSIFVISILLTAISPMQVFTKKIPGMTEYILLFLFMFKAVGGVVLYYGFAKGKNFNEAIWNSKYYNA